MSNDIVKDTLAQQAAALALSRVPKTRIGQELGLKPRELDRIMRSEEFQNYVKEIGDKAVATALNSFKSKMDELEPYAYAALEQALKDGKLEAVKVWATFVGADKQIEAASGNGTIQVFMPGAQPTEKVVEVKAEDSE